MLTCQPGQVAPAGASTKMARRSLMRVPDKDPPQQLDTTLAHAHQQQHSPRGFTRLTRRQASQHRVAGPEQAARGRGPAAGQGAGLPAAGGRVRRGARPPPGAHVRAGGGRAAGQREAVEQAPGRPRRQAWQGCARLPGCAAGPFAQQLTCVPFQRSWGATRVLCRGFGVLSGYSTALC